MSIPTERIQHPPPHTSQLSLVPPNERANLTHMGFTLLPYARYFHLRWLRTISFRILLPAFSLALAFCPPRHSTVTDRITLCWHRRCQIQQHQRQSRPPSLPHDMPIIWARCHRQSHPVRCAGPKHSLPRPKRAQGYQKYLDTSPAVS
jgi:hypothetical protein